MNMMPNPVEIYRAVQTPKIIVLMLLLLPLNIALPEAARAQESLETGKVAPMGNWLEYREVTFNNKPILVHLRTGYERAIILPEAVVPSDEQQTLPGTEIFIDGNIVAFYPTITFPRLPVIFVGLDTGTVYDLRIRASTEGIRQPMRVNK